jgi:hypothetical protein
LHQLYSCNGSYGPSKTTRAVAVRAIFGPVPLQIFAVAALVTDGFGLTVTVTGLILKHPALVVPLM